MKTFKWILFQSHWLLGISAGLVLALIGVTGGLLSFENETLRLLNPGVMRVSPQAQSMLSPPELLQSIARAQPTRRIGTLSTSTEPGRAARVGFLPPDNDNPRGAAPGGRVRMQMHFVNPYNGELLGTEDDLRGHDFLHLMEDLHRRLAAGDTGKAITGACTVVLIWLALSGLYLRWPRRALDWRTWLKVRWRLRGRPFLYSLHAVIGTWTLALYLLAALTGLYWSYEPYREAVQRLSGAAPMARAAPPAGADLSTLPQLQTAWNGFLSATAGSGYSSVSFNLPDVGQPLLLTYLDANPAHERASNRITLDAANGEVLKHERYDDKAAGARIGSSMFALHRGSFFGVAGTTLMMLASLGMPLFAISGWMLYLQRRKVKTKGEQPTESATGEVTAERA